MLELRELIAKEEETFKYDIDSNGGKILIVVQKNHLRDRGRPIRSLGRQIES